MTKIPPVAHDDTQGDYQVVVSFRVPKTLHQPSAEIRAFWETAIRELDPSVQGLSVGGYQIGAHGERSEIEGADP